MGVGLLFDRSLNALGAVTAGLMVLCKCEGHQIAYLQLFNCEKITLYSRITLLCPQLPSRTLRSPASSLDGEPLYFEAKLKIVLSDVDGSVTLKPS